SVRRPAESARRATRAARRRRRRPRVGRGAAGRRRGPDLPLPGRRPRPRRRRRGAGRRHDPAPPTLPRPRGRPPPPPPPPPLAPLLAGFETNRRRAVVAQEKAERAFTEKENLLNTMQVPLMVVDPNTDTVVYGNRAAAGLGIASGTRVAELIAPDPRARAHYD